MELIVMNLINEIKEMIDSKEFRKKLIEDGVKGSLLKNLSEQKITSTEYQSALEILDKYDLS